jgi:hypothetical protein
MVLILAELPPAEHLLAAVVLNQSMALFPIPVLALIVFATSAFVSDLQDLWITLVDYYSLLSHSSVLH